MRRESAQMVPAWVTADGPANDVVLSTRARMARNVQGSPFPSKAGEADLKRVADRVLDVVYAAEGRFGRLRVIHPSRAGAAERLALVDAKVASRQHVTAGKYRPVVLNQTGTLSLMVNEEDHLRIQCILPGMQPMAALQMAQEFDGFIGDKIGYAKTDNYGYLTSSLANIGTGLRLSVLLHLVGLSLLEEAVPALTAAAELKISVRGLFGEGTGAFGDIFQVSNETTIGFSEKEITSRVRAAADHLISREREARRKLVSEKERELREAVAQVEEKLAQARSLGGREAMTCLSLIRLGSEMGIGPRLSPRGFNELLASMRLPSDGRESGDGVKRARLVREKLLQEGRDLQLTFPEEAEQDR